MPDTGRVAARGSRPYPTLGAEIDTLAHYFLKEKLTVYCYNPLGYVTQETRTLISQRNIN